MPFWLAMLPLVLVIGVNAVLTYWVFPNIDFAFVNEKFPDLKVASQLGLWSIIISLLVACAVLVVTRWAHWKHLQTSVTKQPPSKGGGFGLRAESPDTHRLNDASLLRFSTI